MDGPCVHLQKKAMITGASGSLETPVRLAWILFLGVGVIEFAQLRDSEHCGRLVASGKVSQVLFPEDRKAGSGTTLSGWCVSHWAVMSQRS